MVQGAESIEKDATFSLREALPIAAWAARYGSGTIPGGEAERNLEHAGRFAAVSTDAAVCVC